MKNIIGTIVLAISTGALGAARPLRPLHQARRLDRHCSRPTVLSIPTSPAASSC